MARTVLISNDGPHSPEDWAMVTAEEIFNIDPSLAGGRLIAAKQCQLAIASNLSKFYDDAMNKEKDALASNPAHCDMPHDASEFAKMGVSLVQLLGKSTPWEELLNSPEWAYHAFVTLMHHLHSALHIERLWHSDRNPENTAAMAYKTKSQG